MLINLLSTSHWRRRCPLPTAAAQRLLANGRTTPVEFVADDGEVGVVGFLHETEAAVRDSDLDREVVF